MTTSSELPLVQRAREFRLYNAAGERYIDFYQLDGCAILGHRPGRLSLELKSVLSRGLLGEFPNVYTGRLAKALRTLIPEFSGFRVYEHLLKTEAILTAKGYLKSGERIPEAVPGLAPAHPGPVSRWRPFLEDLGSFLPDIIVPVLPFPGNFTPSVVCFRNNAEDVFPESDHCSPFLLAGMTRIVYDLIRELKERDRTPWTAFDRPGWKRTGPYLVPDSVSEIGYQERFMKFLQHKILLNPVYPGISIIPGVFTPGEVAYYFQEETYGA